MGGFLRKYLGSVPKVEFPWGLSRVFYINLEHPLTRKHTKEMCRGFHSPFLYKTKINLTETSSTNNNQWSVTKVL